MHKLLIIITALAVLISCSNNNTKTDASANGNDTEVPQTVGPDASDLLKTLQGRWQSQADSTFILEFEDTKMRRYNHGALSTESEIEIDGSCGTMPCKRDTTDLLEGWCFMEKGSSGTQCNIIIDCDKVALKYNAVGSPNLVLVFKKL